MELFGFRLLVKDFSAAVHFWRDLMKCSLQFQAETLGYAYFDTGKVVLELMQWACPRRYWCHRDAKWSSMCAWMMSTVPMLN